MCLSMLIGLEAGNTAVPVGKTAATSTRAGAGVPQSGACCAAAAAAMPAMPALPAAALQVSCMPGGTASNIVAYIARGDMPLSIMMTTASTIMAVFTTPLLTSLLVGTLVPVDARAMFLSVLQLVLAPVIVGTAANQLFPRVSDVQCGVGRAVAFRSCL